MAIQLAGRVDKCLLDALKYVLEIDLIRASFMVALAAGETTLSMTIISTAQHYGSVLGAWDSDIRPIKLRSCAAQGFSPTFGRRLASRSLQSLSYFISSPRKTSPATRRL